MHLAKTVTSETEASFSLPRSSQNPFKEVGSEVLLDHLLYYVIYQDIDENTKTKHLF